MHRRHRVRHAHAAQLACGRHRRAEACQLSLRQYLGVKGESKFSEQIFSRSLLFKVHQKNVPYAFVDADKTKKLAGDTHAGCFCCGRAETRAWTVQTTVCGKRVAFV